MSQPVKSTENHKIVQKFGLNLKIRLILHRRTPQLSTKQSKLFYRTTAVTGDVSNDTLKSTPQNYLKIKQNAKYTHAVQHKHFKPSIFGFEFSGSISKNLLEYSWLL